MATDDQPSKARIRVPARQNKTADVGAIMDPGKAWTEDSFENVAAALGYGTNNLSSGGSYNFNPITRTHIQLAFMYRGSWLPRKVVDQVADDMTRAGIEITADSPPDEIAKVHEVWRGLKLWEQLRDTIKWARLYGGAMAVLVIDGQRMDTPLNVNAIGKGDFRGVMVFDRWVIYPEPGSMIKEYGANFGYPEYYTTTAGPEIPTLRVHHSRCIRMEGDPLPYWQKIVEMGWGASVIEQLYDRMLAFDSATAGAAQLIYKAHLRTMKVKNLRSMISSGEKMLQAFYRQVYLVRQMQTNEGLTVIDSEDDMQYHTNTAMSGISDALARFGEQIAGATGIPLVVLFGQSPSGFSTGDTDVRNYYDRIASKQQSELEEPVRRLINIIYQSEFGKPPPDGWSFSFNSLWQMSENDKASVAVSKTGAIVQAHSEGIISDQTAMRELKQMARETGMFSNIDDADAAAASDELPDDSELTGMLGHNGGPALEDDPQLSGFPEGQKAGKKPRLGEPPAEAEKAPAAKKSGLPDIERTKDGMAQMKVPGFKRFRIDPALLKNVKYNKK